MPLYIPWLTETIKKRGVRYLLHHYLGQFFEEKLTLEQLSIDIYEGKGSIRNLALDVDGLNDELDFIPFTFLDGCLIGQISVDVPWSSLATDACRVELDGAQFFCRLKTSADAGKSHCIESTLLTRSMMTSSMQMAEEIVTTEDDDETDSIHHDSRFPRNIDEQGSSDTKKKDANQMFEGLEMFAQLIDSVLRRTKLTARNTLFQIQPHNERDIVNDDENSVEANQQEKNSGDYKSDESLNKSDISDETNHSYHDGGDTNRAINTVEFFIKFFRCEEMIDQTQADDNSCSTNTNLSNEDGDETGKSLNSIPEKITKLLTLEDVEMRIDGVPVSNLIGKHTITIKFNGQKSEISIFSSSPLLAVISHRQLETFFNVFDGSKGQDVESSSIADGNQKLMSPEDYAKIENQLLESVSIRGINSNDLRSTGSILSRNNKLNETNHPYYTSTSHGLDLGGRRWAEGGDQYSESQTTRESEHGYLSPNMSINRRLGPPDNSLKIPANVSIEPNLNHIEAFSCELKLPGIWLCILKDNESLPPLLKPYADSINSYQTIHKYIDDHIKMPHIRCLALKVAVDITALSTNIFIGDLDISEHLEDASRMSPVIKLLQSDQITSISSSKYKASIKNGNEIMLEMLTKTRIIFDPTIIDRIFYDYKLIKMNNSEQSSGALTKLGKDSSKHKIKYNHHQSDLNLTLRGDQVKIELLCPVPDLTPAGLLKRAQLRPQSFIFELTDINLTWHSDKLNISANKLLAFVKTQPMQKDIEAVKFIESTSRGNDRILITLEPSPSNLDHEFNNDIEQTLNESSMYDSIYVSQATESRLPTDIFQTKRKVVRASFQDQQASNRSMGPKISECDYEKILTPGDRQHLLDYLKQTIMFTKLSLNLHMPICDVEFEDKEQLDLIYNRFGNDFIFWQPNCLGRAQHQKATTKARENIHFKRPHDAQDDDDEILSHDSDNESSENSFHSMSHGNDSSHFDCYDNEITCKVEIDNLLVKFNHQSCASALKQEISAENFLLGIVIDVNKKPNTLLSIVADNLEMCTDSDTVLEGNFLGDKNSTFGLSAEIKRPTKQLKDIKLAIQLKNGLFNDFRSETYTRFWKSINVTDEPILGYIAPQIVTELHVDVLNTNLIITRAGARPALLAVDELYLTSMVMEQTSQAMIRLIADEASLYMKRDKQGLEIMKNYICLIDSGLIDLDIKFGQDDRIEFGVINNVITVRVCQDSLNALCKLFNALVKNSSSKHHQIPVQNMQPQQQQKIDTFKTIEKQTDLNSPENIDKTMDSSSRPMTRTKDDNNKIKRSKSTSASSSTNQNELIRETSHRHREINLLADAMNDYSITSQDVDDTKKRTTTLSKYASSNSMLNPVDNHESSYQISNRYGAGHQAFSGRGHNEHRFRSDNDHDEVTTREVEDEADEQDYESGSDAPPMFQQTASSSSTSSSSTESSSSSGDDHEDDDGDDDQDGDDDDQSLHTHDRDPNACLLDESNPKLGDIFSQPLLPSSYQKLSSSLTNSNDSTLTPPTSLIGQTTESTTSPSSTTRPMDESGFFVIGDDDVGAGIIDKRQHEPAVRKLIDGPINIIDNHFKMTKPRTIPEMLVNSLERYVLEEMTLVVNLYGGHDFDDNADDDDDEMAAQETSTTNTTLNDLDTMSELATERDPLNPVASGSQSSVRSRAGSIAGTRHQQSSDSGTGSLRRQTKMGARRKNLSEGCGNSRWADLGGKLTGEQRVRFGEGAVNLWESLDLMSSPDFLGARSRPNQTQVNSDLKQAGGTWRENDVCIQLTLSKVKLLYEVADDSRGGHISVPHQNCTSKTQTTKGKIRASSSSFESNLIPAISWRFMLFVQEIEVKDRIAASDINKMLYEYCTESMPKRSTQMLSIKNVATINPSDGCEECDLRVALKPLRLNIDQDTLLFLIEFCTAFLKELTKQQQQQQQKQQQSSSSSSSINSSGCGANGANGRAASNYIAKNTESLVDPVKQSSGQTENVSLGRSVGAAKMVQQQQQTLGKTAQSGAVSELESKRNPDARHNQLLRQRLNTSGQSPLSSLSTSRKILSDKIRPERNTKIVTNNDINIRTTVIAAGGDHRTTDDEDNWSSSEDGGNYEDDDDDDDASVDRERVDGRLSRGAESPGGNIKQPQQRHLPTHCHTDDLSGSANQQPIYIKSFTFSPDVPIRIDYHAKHMDFEQGALAGILMGLAHLDHSELVLRRVQAKHGMRGLDRVLLFAINSWLSDIKRNQLPSILGGVGPMHSVIQLFQGMRDLIWMPIDHYRKDGRLVRGLQRGASSFSSSTAMAAINLVNRFISIVQCTAQIAHDIVTPPTMSGQSRRRLELTGPHGQSSGSNSPSRRNRRRQQRTTLGQGAVSNLHKIAGSGAGGSMIGTGVGSTHGGGGSGGLNQPRNFCEGVAVGFNILKEGFNDTARNVTVGMQAEDMRSAVGELVRQIPSTLLNPIISATEGAQSVLVGIRNQIAPDARREDQEKWKGRVRG